MDLSAIRTARAKIIDWEHWMTEQHPLNQYPEGHLFHKPKRPRPWILSEIETEWNLASQSLPWEESAPLPRDPEPGTIALWRMQLHAIVPVCLVRRQGRMRDGRDWFVERRDDPDPKPRTRIPGWESPALPLPLYRASPEDLRVVPESNNG